MERVASAAFASLERATHRTLHEHAYEQIREALMVGRFMPGQKMTIRGLADALHISPTPIREALHRLNTEGALRAGSNRRMMVPQLSIEKFCELRDIRLSLEGLATERAVAVITSPVIKTLRDLDAAIRDQRRSGDIDATMRSIYLFHHTLYAAARMPTLHHLIEGLWLRSGPYLRLLFPDYTGREQGRTRAKTLDAVERGDAHAARASMETDLMQTADYLVGLLATQAKPGKQGTAKRS